MMKEMWFDSVAQTQLQHTKQLCVVVLLFSAFTHSQRPECLFRLASLIGFALDAQPTLTKFFFTYYFHPFCLHVPLVAHRVEVTARTMKALIVQRCRVLCRRLRSLAHFQARFMQF